jgi:antitoxin FitA
VIAPAPVSAIISPVKQLITRIDDDLHRRLKERAAEQDRSLNDLVSSVLAAAVRNDAASLRRRIDRSGLRVLPPQPPVPRSRAAVIERQRGSGRAVSEALAADRDVR